MRIYQAILGAALCALLMTAAAAQAAQKTYDTPQAAVDDLLAATRGDNLKELYAILGDEAKKLVESGDAVADNDERELFAAAYAEKHALVDSDGRHLLEVGGDGWLFPIPLVRNDQGRWFFDTHEGAEILIDRRIGHNELSAIQVCLAYADAQQEYYRLNPDRSSTPHYAARIASSSGKRDGLYWQTKEGEAPSPLGPLVARAEAGGYETKRQDKERPYFGYHYRVLTSQGIHAKDGDRNYVKNGRLTGGFALLAYPATYGASGVMTFMINQDGVVYQKNLGKETATMARHITSFDPDDTWEKTEDL